MEQLMDLKAILHSKWANIFYLDKCRITEINGRVRYLTKTDKEYQYGNIPVADTTVMLFGAETSVTRSAMKRLARADILVGFSGSEAWPLFAGTDIEWCMPKRNLHPSGYLQGWKSFWFDRNKRLDAAKQLQRARVQFMKKVWANDSYLITEGFNVRDDDIHRQLANNYKKIGQARKISELLQLETELSEQLHKIGAYRTRYVGFSRDKNAVGNVNTFLNHGNYLAYGLAACALWVLGIPNGFSVKHGKTRSGTLVYDVANLIKDTLILPWAFICARENATEQDFRMKCLQAFSDHRALDFMFDQIKILSLQYQNQEKAGDAA